MANYDVTITNGSGSARMKAGTYNVTATAQGYSATSLDPKTFTATASDGSQTFTLLAEGTLELIFNETGASGGTPITSGSVVMTDSTGSIEYGSAVNINSTGVATFANVPFGTSESPITLYFKQLSTDDSHEIESNIISVELSSATETQYVINVLLGEQTFTLSDSTYSGLPINGTLNFNNE
ncbi:MAG: hypothetical protein IKQ31_01655 [Clostridia bacterium]|nr:hypothetical protein [Clostridia bacterium]